MMLDAYANLLNKYINFDKLTNHNYTGLNLEKSFNIKNKKFTVICDEKVNTVEKKKIYEIIKLNDGNFFQKLCKEYSYIYNESIKINVKITTKKKLHLLYIQTNDVDLVGIINDNEDYTNYENCSNYKKIKKLKHDDEINQNHYYYHKQKYKTNSKHLYIGDDDKDDIDDINNINGIDDYNNNLNKLNYFFIGNDRGHPFLITENLFYGGSDGTCPDFNYEDDIYSQLITFIQPIINNKCH